MDEQSRMLQQKVAAIEYEHWMLLETGFALRNRWESLPLIDKNIFVEAHAVHLRNLVEFLCHEHGQNHMRAIDAEFGAVSWQQAWVEDFRDLFERASAEIAHLSAKRVVREKTNWLPEHALRVEQHFQRWLSQTSDEVRRHFSDAHSRHVALFEIVPDAEAAKAAASGGPFNTLTVGRHIGPDTTKLG